jgi:hypothetical protein
MGTSGRILTEPAGVRFSMAIGLTQHTLYSEWPVDTLFTRLQTILWDDGADLSRKIGERKGEISPDRGTRVKGSKNVQKWGICGGVTEAKIALLTVVSSLITRAYERSSRVRRRSGSVSPLIATGYG